MTETSLPLVEVYVSPELAGMLQPGSSLVLRVDRQQPVGKGILLVGSGSVASAEPLPMATADVPAEVPDPAETVLAGSAFTPVPAEVVLAGSVPLPAEPVPVPTPLPTPALPAEPSPVPPGKSKFGRRGPQLLGVEDTPSEVAATKTEASVPPAPVLPQILTADDFYAHLKSVDAATPPEAKDGRRLTREDAVKVFSTATLGRSVWIMNVTKGQLVVSDIGLRMRFGDALNIGGIPASRLKNSVDLFEALSRGLVKIVTPEEAHAASSKTDRRLRRKFDLSSIKTYDSADDVYDEIDEGFGQEIDGDEPPRRRPAPRRRQEDADFEDDELPPRRRRARSEIEDDEPPPRRRRRADDIDDEDLVRASVEPPPRFRKMKGADVTEDEPSEYDLIYGAVERRERELKSRTGREEVEVEDVLGDEGVPVSRPRKKQSATWGQVSRLEY